MDLHCCHWKYSPTRCTVKKGLKIKNNVKYIECECSLKRRPVHEELRDCTATISPTSLCTTLVTFADVAQFDAYGKICGTQIEPQICGYIYNTVKIYALPGHGWGTFFSKNRKKCVLKRRSYHMRYRWRCSNRVSIHSNMGYPRFLLYQHSTHNP